MQNDLQITWEVFFKPTDLPQEALFNLDFLG